MLHALGSAVLGNMYASNRGDTLDLNGRGADDPAWTKIEEVVAVPTCNPSGDLGASIPTFDNGRGSVAEVVANSSKVPFRIRKSCATT